jgi:hypothetical protein
LPRQLLPKRSAALNIKRLADCFMTDPHPAVLGKVDLQPT